MKTMTIASILIGALLVGAGTGEAFAGWSTHFKGTRDQVRTACVGQGHILTDLENSTVCQNALNGTMVDCDDTGNCIGSGSGPALRVDMAAGDVLGSRIGF